MSKTNNRYVQFFDWLFLLLAFVELSFVLGFPSGRFITKPLLLISLAIFYILSSTRPNPFFVAALFFAFMGDTLLLFDGLFLYGLGAFLIMQMLYTICFIKQKGRFHFAKFFATMLIIAVTSYILKELKPSLEESMVIPIFVYAGAISMMAITAVARQFDSTSYVMLLIGVFSFIISDALIGINRFGQTIVHADLLIMATYILAQYLIVKGYLKYQESNNTAA